MRLKKAPVIEAWVEFRFDPREDAPAWQPDTANGFFRDRLGGRFVVTDYLLKTELAFEGHGAMPDVRPGPATIERCRAFTADKDKAVQVGRDILVFNILRKADAWPEYPALRDAAMRACEEYVEHVRPASLREVALHYRDLVCLPSDEKGLVQLEDYVRIFPQVPEETFGPMESFSYEFRFLVELPGLPGKSLGRLSVRTEPPDAARPGQLRQTMDWELRHGISASPGAEDLVGWLDKAHSELLHRFRLAFTDRGWALFDPEDGEL